MSAISEDIEKLIGLCAQFEYVNWSSCGYFDYFLFIVVVNFCCKIVCMKHTSKNVVKNTQNQE